MSGPGRDFASLLDDLMRDAAEPDAAAAAPTIPFDYLSVADELYSGRITVTSADAAAQYREATAGMEADLADLLSEIEPMAEPEAAPQPEPLPPIEPEAIALELGLAGADRTQLGRLRRAFALRNHPDRVAPHLRQRALVRMQVANMLIDEAGGRTGQRGR